MRDLLGGAGLGKIEPNVQNLWEGLPLPEPPPARYVGQEHGPKRVQLIFGWRRRKRRASFARA